MPLWIEWDDCTFCHIGDSLREVSHRLCWVVCCVLQVDVPVIGDIFPNREKYQGLTRSSTSSTIIFSSIGPFNLDWGKEHVHQG